MKRLKSLDSADSGRNGGSCEGWRPYHGAGALVLWHLYGIEVRKKSDSENSAEKVALPVGGEVCRLLARGKCRVVQRRQVRMVRRDLSHIGPTRYQLNRFDGAATRRPAATSDRRSPIAATRWQNKRRPMMDRSQVPSAALSSPRTCPDHRRSRAAKGHHPAVAQLNMPGCFGADHSYQPLATTRQRRL